MSDSAFRDGWFFTLAGAGRTSAFGRFLGEEIVSPGVIALFGGLGTGKTTLIQAVGCGLGVQSPITSPTYTIVNHYQGGRLTLVHVDCYRIGKEEALYGIGLDELLEGGCLLCLEWAERAAGLLPARRMEVHLSYESPEKRGAAVRLLGNLWPALDDKIPAWIERNAPQ